MVQHLSTTVESSGLPPNPHGSDLSLVIRSDADEMGPSSAVLGGTIYPTHEPFIFAFTNMVAQATDFIIPTGISPTAALQVAYTRPYKFQRGSLLLTPEDSLRRGFQEMYMRTGNIAFVL